MTTNEFVPTKEQLKTLEKIKAGVINSKKRHEVPEGGFSPRYISSELMKMGEGAFALWIYLQGSWGEHPNARKVMQLAT